MHLMGKFQMPIKVVCTTPHFKEGLTACVLETLPMFCLAGLEKKYLDTDM